jgi:transposase
VKRVLAGERPSAVTRSLGLCRTSIYRWLRAHRSTGGLARPAAPPAGRRPRVSASQAAILRTAIVARRPSDHGIEGDFWTRERVRELVRRRANVDVGRMGAGRLLRRMGVRAGKPFRRIEAHHPGSSAPLRSLARRLGDLGEEVLVLRLEPCDSPERCLALATQPNGGFYCEDLPSHRPDLVGFLARCAPKGSRPVFGHDDAEVWGPALLRAGLSDREAWIEWPPVDPV